MVLTVKQYHWLLHVIPEPYGTMVVLAKCLGRRVSETLGCSGATSISVRVDSIKGEYSEDDVLWEQLSAGQRAVLQALAQRGTAEIYSQAVRSEFRLGPASTVQKAIQSLDSKDILDRYKDAYFFLDPLLPHWIGRRGE